MLGVAQSVLPLATTVARWSAVCGVLTLYVISVHVSLPQGTTVGPNASTMQLPTLHESDGV
jgi:hypothetical protein